MDHVEAKLEAIAADPACAARDAMPWLVDLVVVALTSSHAEPDRRRLKSLATAFERAARHAGDDLEATAGAARLEPLRVAMPDLLRAVLRGGDRPNPVDAAVWSSIAYIGLDAGSVADLLASWRGRPMPEKLLRALCYERVPTEEVQQRLDLASAADERDADTIDVARRYATFQPWRRPSTRWTAVVQDLPAAYGAGFIAQAWDPVTRTYEMLDALLVGPKWVAHEPPLVAGKGVPRFTLVTIRLMKQLGVPHRGLRWHVVGPNYHLESILQLERATRSGMLLPEAVRHTRSYRSARTPIRQAGHAIWDERVGVRGGQHGTVADVLSWHAASDGHPLRKDLADVIGAEHERVLAAYSMTPQDRVYYGYTTRVELQAGDESAL